MKSLLWSGCLSVISLGISSKVALGWNPVKNFAEGRIYINQVQLLHLEASKNDEYRIDNLGRFKLHAQQSVSENSRVWQGRNGNCYHRRSVAPDSQTRSVRDSKFGIRFQVPTNYQVKSEAQSTIGERLRIQLLNPSDVSFLQCCNEKRCIGHGHALTPVDVTVTSKPSTIRTTTDIGQADPRGFTGIPTRILYRRELRISGQPAVIYTTRSQYPTTSISADIFHPDGKHLVSISTGVYGNTIGTVELKVFETVVSSFSFL